MSFMNATSPYRQQAQQPQQPPQMHTMGTPGVNSVSPAAQQGQPFTGSSNPLNPTLSNYNVSPQQSISLWNQGMAPMQWQANRNAMQAAAAGGLSGGPLNQVTQDANAQFMAAQDPALAQFLQQAQGYGLDQSMFNANAMNQAGQQQAYYNQQNADNLSGSLGNLAGLAAMFAGG